MKSRWGRIALAMVWLTGALLYAFGHGSLFGLGASTDATGGPATIVSVAPALGPQASGAGAPQAGGGGSTDGLIHSLQQKAGAAGDAPTFNQLAAAYMQKARETGDVTYYNLADAAVSRSLDANPKNFDGLAVAAWVRLARHDFLGSARLARQSLQGNVYHSETYGVLGDAELELGDYAGATRDYQHMVDLKPDLASYNRASHIRWLYGDTSGALRIMNAAVTAGASYAENVAWCQAQLGDDDFFLGSPLAAEQAYKESLVTFPRDIYALAGLGRLYAGQHRFALAVEYYNRAIAQVPLPQYVIALGDTYAVMGQPARARQQYTLAGFIYHLYDVNHINIGIDRAQFDADHDQNLGEALRLARSEATWRHDIRTMDILAWVLYKNHDYNGALAAERQALRLGTRDAGFYFHMGMIYKALGDAAGAKAYLQGALLLNPLFDVRQAPVAIATLRHLESVPPGRQAPDTSTPDSSHLSVAPAPSA